MSDSYEVGRIRAAVRKLDAMPKRHRVVDWEPWASMGMRRLSVDNYIVFYLVDDEGGTVTVVRILYSGRNIEAIARETLWWASA